MKKTDHIRPTYHMQFTYNNKGGGKLDVPSIAWLEFEVKFPSK